MTHAIVCVRIRPPTFETFWDLALIDLHNNHTPPIFLSSLYFINAPPGTYCLSTLFSYSSTFLGVSKVVLLLEATFTSGLDTLLIMDDARTPFH